MQPMTLNQKINNRQPLKNNEIYIDLKDIHNMLSGDRSVYLWYDLTYVMKINGNKYLDMNRKYLEGHIPTQKLL